MAAEEIWETTEVLIIGCGPTGGLLTALLGRFGVQNVVLEKQPDITEDPRGITLDEDGIRMLQDVGVYDKVYTEIGAPLGRMLFITSKNNLHERPFLNFDLNTSEGGTGHVAIISQRQPILERYIRQSAFKHDSCQLRSSSTVVHIDEDKDWVYCQYEDGSGATRKIRAKFLVGCDGKRGYTRKLYLEPKGVMMEQMSEFGYKEIWVAMNFRISLPTPESHPKLPFWERGFSPQDVYDRYFPINFRFICNGDRPAVCGRFGNGVERLWRFEFVVKREEDAMLMASEAKTMEIIMPYLTHAGSLYGVPGEEIQFPYDCIEILRSRPFTFSARGCNKWAVGRVMLAGDAAHVFPPFGGQGISSGFRDSSTLAWRLAIAVRENGQNHEQLFSAWYRERKQQLKLSLARTIRNGTLCTQGNTWQFFFLRLFLRFVQLFAPLQRVLEKGRRLAEIVRYQWQEGLAFLPTWPGGVCLPQVYCAPVLASSPDEAAQVRFTDDVIFAPRKKGIFQLLVLLDCLSDLQSTRKALTDLEDNNDNKVPFGNYLLQLNEATFLVQSANPTINLPKATANGNRGHDDVFRLATGPEFAAIPLCAGRPPPLYYDMFSIRKALRGKKFVVVRPDKFVYAACDTVEELREICAGIGGTLGILK